MAHSRSRDAVPRELTIALAQLGSDIRRARLRRSLRLKDVAERCFMTVPTVRKVEAGDPTVSLRAVGSVLWLMGMQDRLGLLLSSDPIGESLETRRQRARERKSSDIEGMF